MDRKAEPKQTDGKGTISVNPNLIAAVIMNSIANGTATIEQRKQIEELFRGAKPKPNAKTETHTCIGCGTSHSPQSGVFTESQIAAINDLIKAKTSEIWHYKRLRANAGGEKARDDIESARHDAEPDGPYVDSKGVLRNPPMFQLNKSIRTSKLSDKPEAEPEPEMWVKVAKHPDGFLSCSNPFTDKAQCVAHGTNSTLTVVGDFKLLKVEGA